jgi:O-acetyl-ADP-ribose deacetylase (regulator of RNase III)
MKTKIKLVKGSVIDQDVEIIVNAANANLQRGGGIDGAIHRASGPELQKYLNELFDVPLEPGSIAVTPGFNLPQTIFHAPGPIWKDGNSGESEHLSNLYDCIMDSAECIDAKSIAFCSISTGIYGYPINQACDIAVSTIINWLNANPDTSIETIVFAMFGNEEYQVYENHLGDLK